MKLKENSVVGIIDSGIGGVSILKQLIQKFGYGNYIYFADNANMPYGSKQKAFLKNRLEEIIKLLRENYKTSIIIIACNTASSILKNKSGDLLPLEFNKNKIYLATPLTKSNLKDFNVIADENLASLIEENIFDKKTLKHIIKIHIKTLNLSKIKNLCLACTHYELAKDVFKKLLPKTNITINSQEIVDLIEIDKSNTLNIVFLSSKKDEKYIKTLRNLAFSED